MQNLKDIRKRIASIKSTMKITGAMKMISISKLKKVQEKAVNSRLYCERLKELAIQVATKTGQITHPAFELRKNPKKVTIVVVTSERGFCGNLNDHIAKEITNFLKHIHQRDVETETFVIGSKGVHHFKKHGMEAEKLDFAVDDPLTGIKAENICRHLLDDYMKGKTDQVLLGYHKFKSISSYQVTLDVFLPIWVKDDKSLKIDSEIDFLYEPSKEKVLDALLMKTIRTSFFQGLLEGGASELAARMIAMDKALNNATDMVRGLTQNYHRVRQAAITRELLDIIGGAEALKSN